MGFMWLLRGCACTGLHPHHNTHHRMHTGIQIEGAALILEGMTIAKRSVTQQQFVCLTSRAAADVAG
jgi:hypothetical protein